MNFIKTIWRVKMTNKELETKLNELIVRVEKLENKSSGKITLEEFFASDKDLVIHCDTEEKANKLLREFGLIGKVLCDKFDVYGKDTCYSNCGLYGNIEDCKAQDYKIYEFEDIILPEEPKWQFTEDEKSILRTLPEEYEWIARDEDNNLFIYIDKPIKKYDHWRNEDIFVNFIVYNHLFQSIKWIDTEPCEFRKYI